MLAPRIDFDLGRNATKIQNSFRVAWRPEPSYDILLGLSWGYRDCGNEYAEGEVIFLMNILDYLRTGEVNHEIPRS